MKKRRLLSIVLSLCMVMAFMPQIVFAADTYMTDDGQFEYTISGENVTIVSFKGNETIVTIPSEIKGCHVISIHSKAFQFNKKITSVTFQSPSYVTSIGGRAFTTCSNLTSITLPDSVTTMGERVFFRCESLASVIIPGSVKSIKENTFAGCTGLTSVTIPDSVTLIEEEAFYGCTGLTSVTIPDSVTLIEKEAFYGCTSLERIFLPDDLDASSANIPDTTTKVRYSFDTNKGEVTITGIDLGTDKNSVAIPETICGYPVVAVVESEQSKVGAHTCNPREVIKSNALKTAGTCQSEAVYYYSCGICGKVYSGGNTFNGEKDSNNHTGTKKWIQNEKQHKQYWNCCDAVVVDYVDHNWNSGVCSVCDYVCKHTGGEATCTSKAICEYCGEKYGELNSSNHDLVNTPAKDATVTETGNKAYWQCKDCDKYFADENGTEEITLDDTVISKLPPEIIEGTGQSITAGEKKALSFTSNADIADFLGVEFDGSQLSAEYYTTESGSIIVTLDADYVATLPAGEHTIGIVSESGTAETTFTVEEKTAPGTTDDSDKDNSSDNDKDSESDEDSVKTGDSTNLTLWLALMLLSGAGIIGVTAYTRRKRTNE